MFGLMIEKLIELLKSNYWDNFCGLCEDMTPDKCKTCPFDTDDNIQALIAELEKYRFLQSIVDKLPNKTELTKAIQTIEKARQTHINWAGYYKSGGEEIKHTGSLAHHEKYIHTYTQVVVMLKTTREAVSEHEIKVTVWHLTQKGKDLLWKAQHREKG